MRPIAVEQSALRYPLDSVLGSPAQVRLLRALFNDVDGPLGVADAARLTGLTQVGARKALDRLQESGVVQRIGSGRALQYQLRAKEPIVDALRMLFGEEQRRYDDLLSSLQSVMRSVPEVQIAWIDELPLRAGYPLALAVVTDARSLSWLDEELRTRLLAVEKEFDLIIESELFTRTDAPEPGADALLLWSAEPSGVRAGTHGIRTHQEADERSLLMARAVAELIQSDPTLMKRAARHLERLARDDQGTAAGDIAEWRQLLETYSPGKISRLLVSDSSRAARLRQSSPFLAVLSPDERDRLMVLMEKLR